METRSIPQRRRDDLVAEDQEPTYSQAIGRSDAFERRISRQANRRPAPPVLRLAANVLRTEALQTNRGTGRERE